jgi:hypothetical protein
LVFHASSEVREFEGKLQPATPTIIVYTNETTMAGHEKRERLAIP